MSRYQNYIGGEWVDAASGDTFVSVNPVNTTEVLGEFAKSDETDVTAAVEAAAKAFPEWRSTPAPVRGQIFFKAVQKLEERADEFTTELARESGKTLAEARGEVNRSIAAMRILAGESTRLCGQTIPSQTPGVFAYTTLEPVGVVALIAPWNFPLGIAAWKITPALIAGNTAVFKPASNTPLISVMFIQLLEECGLPKGVLNMITGPGGPAGRVLSTHPQVKALSFTGSTEVGTALGKIVCERGARMQAEMGGKNPFVILADADLDLAVDHIIFGGFGECGQRCTATSRVIVERSVAEALTDKLVSKAKQITVGNPLDAETTMGAVVDVGQVKTFEHYVAIGKQEGAKLLLGGNRLTEGEYANGYFVEPTIFTDVTPEMTIAQEEIFGPVVSIMVVDSFEQALEWSNHVPFGLSSTIYTNDLRKAQAYIDGIEAGVTHVNLPSTYSESQFPFGGIKQTSLGPREQGKSAIEFYVELKTVYMKA
ncbi:aldehyde dehydrogenase family protein [Paenibacillus sp. J2TS4]|uniref:aldehyde dehydrogenase family protein n=1 Tax=Paenibacillus sp. J2TS4 TaxID=2807194 RepID=UPI001B0D3557|nr:aldehyde dehydrogenase family protein [Paenibacillus sp. J2TS4]GIP34330.1 aldehyde dehydrogenase [Paenibacillus sp. J2TS4]